MNAISSATAHGVVLGGYEDQLGGAAARAAMAVDPIDQQVRAATRDLETTTQRSEGLHANEELLRAVLVAAEAKSGKSTEPRTLHDLQVTVADGRTGPADELLSDAGLLSLVDADGNGKASPSTIEGAMEQVRSEREKLNSGNQLRMIQLQELMHQKNLLLQLATQELSSREQVERRIAENIR